MVYTKPSVEQHKVINFMIFLLFSFLAMFFKTNNFSFIMGITFNFYSLCIILLIKLYGFRLTMFVSVTIQLISIILFKDPIWNVVAILEVIFLGITLYSKPKINIIIWDMIFWICIGAPLTVYIYRDAYNTPINSIQVIQVCQYILNALINVIIADVILTYIPFENLRTQKQHRSAYEINFNKSSFHLSILITLVPFLLSISINDWNNYQAEYKDVRQEGKAVVQNIKNEINQWKKQDVNKLKLFSTVHTGYLEEFLENITLRQKYDVIITDQSKKVIASTDKSIQKEQPYEWYNQNNMNLIAPNLYEVFSSNKHEIPSIIRWGEGFYLYEELEESVPFHIYVKFLMIDYHETILNNYLQQLQIIIMCVIIAIIFSFLINQFLVKTISKLAEMTTGLPNRLKQTDAIEWPVSHIQEIKSLINNFKYMSDNLKQMFKETYNMNDKLESQAQMLRMSQNDLHRLAYYDVLTELPNRLYFQYYLSEILNEAKEKKDCKVAVMFVDMDKFKQINDTLGHDQGDKLLQIIAKRLGTLQNENITVFRLGGDEFVIIVKCNEVKEAEIVALKVLGIATQPIKLLGSLVYIAFSIGISVFPDDDENQDALVKNADIAMYSAKEKGGNCIEFFTLSKRHEIDERVVIENALRDALDQRQFEIYYQPKMNTQTGQISSMEALVRWRHPTLGNISPDKFITIAEDTGLIVEIDLFVMTEACKQLKKWQQSGLPRIPVAVNVSAQDFYRHDLLDIVKSVLQKTSLHPKYLKIEVTESIFIKNIEDVIGTIKKLNNLGVKTSIDDFGKGYSSLNQLLRIPVQEVKLDDAFIKNVDKQKEKADIVRCIIELAHRLQLNVVAEGVETVEEYEYLKQVKCDEIQGFLFSRPLPKDDMTVFLQRNNFIKTKTKNELYSFGGKDEKINC